MTPRTQAMRFRIWQYAAPREWNVTLAEIAEAIGEDMVKVRSAIANNPAWAGRVRHTTDGIGFGIAPWQASAGNVAKYVARDLMEGRISNGEGV